MPMENRYDSPIKQHQRIELGLAEELKRPLPDALVLQRLKRRKLLVRDEIESWERLMGAVHGRPVPQSGKHHASP